MGVGNTADMTKGHTMTSWDTMERTHDNRLAMGNPADYYAEDALHGTVTVWCNVCDSEIAQHAVGQYMTEHSRHSGYYDYTEWDYPTMHACPVCGQWWGGMYYGDIEEK